MCSGGFREADDFSEAVAAQGARWRPVDSVSLQGSFAKVWGSRSRVGVSNELVVFP